MHTRVVLGVGKGVLFREVSSFRRERGSTVGVLIEGFHCICVLYTV